MMAASSSYTPTVTAPTLALINDTSKTHLIKQGAEAKVYISDIFGKPVFTPLHGGLADGNVAITTATGDTVVPAPTLTNEQPPPLPVLIKYRFPKTYRHPSLSTHLTATRTIAEARALVRCARSGVNTPRVICVDEENGVLALELIDGHSVREILGGGSEGDEVVDENDEQVMRTMPGVGDIPLLDQNETMAIMRLVGAQIARMHQAHIIHGDLTTSNMMVRKARGIVEIILIDFGLSTNSTWAEDKAVDLYVLERAFSSTHPDSEHLFAEILASYQATLENIPTAPTKQETRQRPQEQIPGRRKPNKKQGAEKLSASSTVWKDIKRKLDDVRLRGRKRSMVG